MYKLKNECIREGVLSQNDLIIDYLLVKDDDLLCTFSYTSYCFCYR